MDIERLRALEQELRQSAENAQTASTIAAAYGYAASQLRDIIAELGQEVGAVADERLCDFFADVGEVEQFMDDLCNVVTELTGDEGEDDPITVLRRYIATSPAHTSEARDAARLDWLDANGFTAYRAIDPIDGLSGHCVVVHETQRPRRGNVHDTIRGAIDAAMGEAK